MIMFKQSTGLLTLSGLQNKQTGLYVNAGTVNITMFRKADDSVVAQVNNLAFAYVAASNGDWQAIVSSTFDEPKGELYYVVVTAVDGSGNKLTIRRDVPADFAQ